MILQHHICIFPLVSLGESERKDKESYLKKSNKETIVFFFKYCRYHHCKSINKIIMFLFSKSDKLLNKHYSGFSFRKFNLSRPYKISDKYESFSFWSWWSSTNYIHFWVLFEKVLHCQLVTNNFYINLMLIYTINIWIFLMVKLKSTHGSWKIHLSRKSIYNIDCLMFILSPNRSCNECCIICRIWLRNS